jgi:Leucine-rich repeat (LRR) protein
LTRPFHNQFTVTLFGISALAIISGCRPAESISEPATDASVAATATENQRADWNELLELARNERWTRLESDLPLTDAEVAELADLTHLKEIALTQADVSDSALNAISVLTSLEVIVLGNTTVTDQGLAQLAGRKSLRDLNLNQSRVTDRGLEHLAGLSQLELLRLGKSEITDDGLAVLAPLTSLRFLILQNARITGRGFKHLHGLKNLESLYLSGNPLSGEGVEELRHALPRLHPDW